MIVINGLVPVRGVSVFWSEEGKGMGQIFLQMSHDGNEESVILIESDGASKERIKEVLCHLVDQAVLK